MFAIPQEAAKQAELSSSSSIGGWVSWALGYGTTNSTTSRESAEAQFEQL